MVQYLFNSSGEWIAFRDGAYVYDTKGKFIGFLAESGVDVVDIANRYFGTIYEDRLYRKLFEPGLDARFPGYPGHHDPPYLPELAPRVDPPIEADDIVELATA